MCGIIAIANKEEEAVKGLIYGLKQMEYRGYDSAGIIFAKNFELYKSIGSIDNLEKASEKCKDTIGIAHTRWATQGEVSIKNCHPIKIGRYAIIHNGIIEEGKEICEKIKFSPQTDTDTEILLAYYVHLIQTNDLETTLNSINKTIKGSYACAIIQYDSEKIIWMKKGFSPLVLAKTKQGNNIASDQEGVQNAEKIYEITTNGYGYITPNEIKILKGEYKEKIISSQENLPTEKTHKTWLEKEINDQKEFYKKEMPTNLKKDFSQYNGIKLIGCGSSFFAAKLGAIWLEEENYIASAEIASEWNSSKTAIKPNQLAIFISQSGFTTDTLSALLKAKSNYKTLALVNKENSPIESNSDEVVLLKVGNEKSVASSKSFSAQLIKLYQLIKGTLPINLDKKIHKIFDIDLSNIANILSKSKQIIILGKNKMSIIAQEGMLKMTEITYLNIFAFPAGELKHGYISKITKDTHIIILAPEDPILLNKTISSAQEVISRKGNVIWISSKNHINTQHFIQIESMNYDEATFCCTVLMQRLALQIAELLKRSIDKPRNLAKSVTVE